VRSSKASSIKRDIRAKFQRAVNSFFEELNTSSSKITPIRTGRARRGWRKSGKYRIGDSGVMIENQVPYIGLLDEGRSKQAPAGIIMPVLRNLNRKRSRL
jgi:mRNA-degrading endonuclease RelE of RelBE toxin-antitoxin system